MKALALLSGGLDSILAVRLILEQGIDVEAVNFLTIFCDCMYKENNCLSAKLAADKLGIKLQIFEVNEEYLEIVKKPKYGYGSQMNPCIDCRIFMLKKARQYMKQIGAEFIVTGEVLNERPMSQRLPVLKLIEREADLQGLIVRPLSAKLFEPTIPEKKGLIEREKLLAISGRSRKPQIFLARKYHITDYAWPAGGCLLADPGFSGRLRDLMRYVPDFTLNDVKLLKLGRHFRLTDKAKLIVGRNAKENEMILSLGRENDYFFYPLDAKGPIALGRVEFNSDLIHLSGGIIARYCDKENNLPLKIVYKKNLPYEKEQIWEDFALSDLEIKRFII